MLLFIQGCDDITTEQDIWEVNPSFSYSNLEMVGSKNKLSITDPKFIKNEQTEHLLYFFDEVPSAGVKVVGISKELNRIEPVLIENGDSVWEVGVQDDGRLFEVEDSFLPLTLSFPHEGVWRLDFFIDDRFITHTVINVESRS